MYQYYFALKERPFKLVPNPEYFFLSRCHEEAMAHLTYAISQGDGFVEITGEVGTGKTTLCRVFLENLDKSTEAAYIFNPKLDSTQLLKSINDEFGIDSSADTNKDLIDVLNAFLMKKMAEEKKVILLIDEAQNLTKEILEMIRLLSNLETNRHKLLQIILVGQPELRDTLESYELRQLGQRITLRCHLVPFTFTETRRYIEHRIHIASRKPVLKFTYFAIRSIYHYSSGIPRLINIACDRALLTAFGLDQKKITKKITHIALHELADRNYLKRFNHQRMIKIGSVSLFLCLAVLSVFLISTGIIRPQPFRSFMNNDKSEHLISGLNPPVSTHQKILKSETPEDLYRILKTIDKHLSRNAALKAALNCWIDDVVITPALNSLEDDEDFFHYTAKRNGFMLHRLECDFNLLRKINLPVIISISLPTGQPLGYFSIIKLNDEKVTINGLNDESLIEMKPDILKSYCSNGVYIPWKNFLEYKGTIPINAPSESIIMLKMHMQDIGFRAIEINANYDENTKEAVKQIQKKYGLKPDGIVGPLTKIALYNEKKSFRIPHLIN